MMKLDLYEIIVFLCEASITGIFFNNLLKGKYAGRYITILWSELFCGIAYFTMQLPFYIRFLLFMIFGYLFVWLLFTDTIWQKTKAFLIYFSVSITALLTSYFLFGCLGKDSLSLISACSAENCPFRLLFLAILSVLLSIAYQLIRKVQGPEMLWIFFTQTVVGAGECIAILAVASLHKGAITMRETWMIVAATVCMVITNMSVGLLAPYLIKQVAASKNIDYGKELSTMEYKYYEISLANDRKIRQMRHDISNHIQTVYSLLKNGENEKSLTIVNELKQRYAGIEQIVYCDNPVINIVLANKKAEAEKNGIETHIKIKENLKNLPISDFDLSTVICNLADNAIRGCIESCQMSPRLVVEIVSKNNYLVIRVLNSCKISMNIDSTDYIITTKSNSQTHGFGMSIIAGIAKRYNGDFIVSAQNGIFTATAVFSMK